ncbi:MAG TPA: alkaline phosphatase PhoX, partial [Thermoanaerobaculia bacterium]|nr:alkaline phosphatase PhoX [Thermoanaerobaculia bacterium]
MLTRRTMIATTAAALAGLTARRARGASVASPYGPLFVRQADNSDVVLLMLPRDFRYTVVAQTGVFLDDGNPAPPFPDGMAAFQVGDELRLVRNHEVRGVVPPLTTTPSMYDGSSGGGTTTIVVDPFTRSARRTFVSLSGSSTNCAGGATPWGSWITCEETTAGAGSGYSKPHGYCFEVPAAANGPVPAVPLRHLGRFVHEAAAVDPLTGIVYLTEDRERAGLYRCLPARPFELAAGGRLQMLAVRGAPGYEAARGQTVGARLPVTWVDIDDPDPLSAEANPGAVFDQGRARGGAVFRRLEGARCADGSLFFISTTGGERSIGQVWELRTQIAATRKRRAVGRGGWEGDLALLFESESDDMTRMPDNVTLTPRGSLLLCEDNPDANFLRVLTPHGDIFPLARNVAPGFERTEFAG